jgi:hypothetical protein
MGASGSHSRKSRAHTQLSGIFSAISSSVTASRLAPLRPSACLRGAACSSRPPTSTGSSVFDCETSLPDTASWRITLRRVPIAFGAPRKGRTFRKTFPGSWVGSPFQGLGLWLGWKPRALPWATLACPFVARIRSAEAWMPFHITSFIIHTSSSRVHSRSLAWSSSLEGR